MAPLDYSEFDERSEGFIRDEVSIVEKVFDTGDTREYLQLAASWKKNPQRAEEVKERVGEEVFLVVQNMWLSDVLDATSRPSSITFPREIEEINIESNERKMREYSEMLENNKKRLREIQAQKGRS